MSYVALYRKFRPNEFDDVKGQDHIVTALRNQISTNRIGHAYLFSGTRGTGKTTIAKIMAKAVNCEQPINGSPCNCCSMCQSINSQTSLNVVEIDAASNNGVDNIRQIVDEVQYSPTEGKYKVYIIDEVHMLSTGAFNALLKTLEEPPEYVIFILATTEAHKIPVTILSRCQRYEFKRMQVTTIIDRLNELMAKEHIEAEDEAIKYIAKCADGAMRDALSLMDQCISFYIGQKLTYESVLDVLGAVDTDVFKNMFDYIVQGRVSLGLKLIDDVILDGKDLSQFVLNFTWYLRNIMIVKTSEKASDLLDMPQEKIIDLKKMSVDIDIETLIRYIRILSELSNQLKYATQKRVVFETAFIKLCKPQMEDNLEAVINRINILEKKLAEGVQITSSDKVSIDSDSSENTIGQVDGIPTKEQKEEILKAMPEEIKEVAKNWKQVLNKLPISIRIFLENAVPTVGNDNTLVLVFDDEMSYSSMSSEMHLTEISNAITAVINKSVNIRTQKKTKDTNENEVTVDISKLINADVTYVD